jgi:hypothetical protein
MARPFSVIAIPLACTAAAVAMMSCSAKDEILDHLGLVDIEIRLEKVDVAGGTFAQLAPPKTKRFPYPILANEKIFLVGGIKANAQYSDVVEAYDVKTSAWSTLSPWPNPRLTEFAEARGVICAFAGTRDVTDTDAVECFDIASDRWSSRAPFPGGRNAVEAASVDGKFYVVRSSDPQVTTPEGTALHVYDPAADAWAAPKVPPKVCAPDSIVLVGTTLYLLNCKGTANTTGDAGTGGGGTGGGGDGGGGDGGSGDAGDAGVPPASETDLAYDTATGIWSPIPRAGLDSKQSQYQSFAVGKQIVVVVPKVDATGARLAIFDTELRKWRSAAKPPVEPWSLQAFAYKNKVYAVVPAEVNPADPNRNEARIASGSFYEYDTVSDGWRLLGSHGADTREQGFLGIVVGEEVYALAIYTELKLSIH